MKLQKILHLVLVSEIIIFVISMLLPDSSSVWLTEDEGSTFSYFWRGLWYLLLFLWITGWVLAFRGSKLAFWVYGAGWIAGLIYALLSPPSVTMPLASFLEGIVTLLGGSILTLLALKTASIGDWDSIESKRMAGAASPDA
jgi:xanthosine utilization system XapX-like protein